MKAKMTAAELMAKLNADPKFLAAQAQRDEEFEGRAEEYRRAEAPLVRDLANVGVNVQSVWDLVNTKAPYPSAVPILIAHLSAPYPVAIRDGIARALAIPEGKTAWSMLVRMYREEPKSRAKDGLAVAVANASDETVIGDVIELARDSQLGSSRILLLSALERSTSSQARAALMSLGTDPDLAKEIEIILRRLAHRTRRRANV
jgi:hypothetical protein